MGESLKPLAGKRGKGLGKALQKFKIQTFFKKWSGISIGNLSKLELANAIKGYTQQANKIAKLIEEDKMIVRILDDAEFEKGLLASGEVSPEDVLNVAAYCEYKTSFHRTSTTVESFTSEIIHEGTHVIENIEGLQLNVYSSEKAAYFHERAFQTAIGMHKEHKTIKNMLDHIYTNF